MEIKDLKLVADEQVKKLNSMTDEQHFQRHKALFERDKKAFEGFSRSFKNGFCTVCRNQLDSFDINTPCCHWLLLPAGFKKKHLSAVTDRFSLMQVQNYLRWVANQEAYAKNINDLDQDDDLIKETIRWNNVEWSLSCKSGDLEGHGKREPHYHMQIRRDNRPLVRFNEFHLPLSDEDIVQLEAIRHPDSGQWQGHPFGEGMHAVLSDDPHQIVTDMVSPDEPDEAMLSVDTLVLAKPDKKLTVGDLLDMIEGAKNNDESLASASRRLENVSVESTIMLGPGVVQETPRTGGRRRRKKN